MPKSRKRKGAKTYRQKPNWRANYSVPDPLHLFRTIGRGMLDTEEEEAACLLLLNTMGAADDGSAEVFKMRGIDWPPKTTDDIRAIGKKLVEIEAEEQTSGATH
jgi:hypothetical protein